MAEPKKVTELYAFICIDDDGDEAVPGVQMQGVWHPMMGADLDNAESFMDFAQQIANDTGKPIRILRFTQFEQIGEIRPRGKND